MAFEKLLKAEALKRICISQMRTPGHYHYQKSHARANKYPLNKPSIFSILFLYPNSYPRLNQHLSGFKKLVSIIFMNDAIWNYFLDLLLHLTSKPFLRHAHVWDKYNQKVWCTEQSLLILYFEEITATCAVILVLLMYLFYVKYPYDKEKPEVEEAQ